MKPSIADTGACHRLRVLAAVIASCSVAGLALGHTIPLVSLVLEHRGFDGAMIGLQGAAPALGILLGSPLVPRLVRLLGARNLLLVSITLVALPVLALSAVENFGQWLGLRFLMGAGAGMLFTVSETWINQVVEDAVRGRWIAVYVTVLAGCTAAGPLLIGFTGIHGVLPFAVPAVIMASGALPLLWLRGRTPDLPGQAAFSAIGFARVAPVICAAVLLFAFMDGLVLSILPLFGLLNGYPPPLAAAMVTALLAGNLFLQFPIGWLADHMDRTRLLAMLALAVLGFSVVLPLVAPGPLLWPSLFLLGASAGGMYTVAVILLGQWYRGADLVAANAAFGMLWGLGHLLGPLGGGAAVQWGGADGLPLVLALATLLFLGLLWRLGGVVPRALRTPI